MPRAKPKVSATLFGGPMNGTKIKVERSTEEVKFGSFFTYTFAGKHQGELLFVIKAKSRAEQRFVYRYIAQNGQDPRIAMIMAKPVPFRKEKA